MKETALVIMVAGIGSWFGGGIKQLEPVGPGEEIIVDYPIHDVMEAGFNRVILIIRKDLEKDSKEAIGNRTEKVVSVECAHQELSVPPDGHEVTLGRTKSWRTGQAVLVTKGLVDGPSPMIGADDCYGKEGFKKIHDYMVSDIDTKAGVHDLYMGGFVPSSTFSDNGIVTRGVCQVGDGHTLKMMDETYNIRMTEGGLQITDEQGNPVQINPDQPAFTNMRDIPASFLDELEKGLPRFLDNLKEGDVKSEHLFPRTIDDLVQSGRARVTVLDIPDKWFGVIYKEDKQVAVNTARKPIDVGVYKEKLYD